MIRERWLVRPCRLHSSFLACEVPTALPHDTKRSTKPAMGARRESEGKKTTGALKKKRKRKKEEGSESRPTRDWHVSGHNHTRPLWTIEWRERFTSGSPPEAKAKANVWGTIATIAHAPHHAGRRWNRIKGRRERRIGIGQRSVR